VRRSIPTLLVHGLIVAVALLGCKKQPTEQPDGAQPDAKPSEPAAETPEQGCKRMLERFGEDVVEVELDVCVSALTDGTELGVCREAGADVEKDFRSCFDQCMGTVAFDAAAYSPGDSSTSPVANCVGGCFSNTCE
jgi:hypothetical protein